MRVHFRNSLSFRYLLIGIVISAILFSLGAANAENKSDDKGDKSEQSKEQTENTTTSEGELKEAEEKTGELFQRLDETVAGQSSEAMDLEELFREAKDAKSLEEILRQREKGASSVKPIKPEEFVGPPINVPSLPQTGEQASHPFVGPLPLPDVNLWGMYDDDDGYTYFDDYVEIPIDFDDSMPPEDRKYIDLSADTITRDKLNNVIFLEGNAKVVYEDVIILSEYAEFNDEEKWGKFWGAGGVLAESEDGLSRSQRLEAFFADDEKIAYLQEKVEIFIYGRDYEDELDEDAPRKERMQRALGQDDTTIYCDQATYAWGKRIFHAWVEESEVVKMIQDGRNAQSLAVYADRDRDITILEGKVNLWHKNGDWLFDRDVVTDKENKWSNALLRPETTITCHILEIDGEAELTILEGNVLAVQKDKRGSADKVIQNEKDQILTGEGNVKARQENGDWLIKYKIVDPEEESEETIEDIKKPTDIGADRFSFWMVEENFLAEGNCSLIQDDQSASADKVEYEKETDSLKIFGNVTINRKDKDKKDNNLISDKGVLWLTTKVYEAFGNVESSTKIDLDSERENLKEE